MILTGEKPYCSEKKNLGGQNIACNRNKYEGGLMGVKAVGA